MRLELTGTIAAAQFELQAAMASSAPDAAREAGTHLAMLDDLQRQIGTASPAALAAMRRDIVAATGAARETVQAARSGATSELTIRFAELAEASRAKIESAVANMHQFDRWLHFASQDESDDYRRREAERRAYIDAQLATGKPAGVLNAAGATVAQMADAKAHGAGNSPEFGAQWKDVAETLETMRNAAIAAGASTAEVDQRLREDLTRTMASMGWSAGRIDAHCRFRRSRPSFPR